MSHFEKNLKNHAATAFFVQADNLNISSTNIRNACTSDDPHALDPFYANIGKSNIQNYIKQYRLWGKPLEWKDIPVLSEIISSATGELNREVLKSPKFNNEMENFQIRTIGKWKGFRFAFF